MWRHKRAPHANAPFARYLFLLHICPMLIRSHNAILRAAIRRRRAGQYDLAAQLVPVADPAATDPDGSHEVPLSSAHVHAELLAPQDAHRWKLCDRGSRSPMCVERSESEQRVEAGVNNYFAESLGSEAWACLADSGEDACKAGGETCTVSDGQLRSCAEDGQLLLEMESEFLDWNEVAADGVEWRSFRHTELWPVRDAPNLICVPVFGGGDVARRCRSDAERCSNRTR
jgi:hypothetical protein